MNYRDEVWKNIDIEPFEKSYMISNLGRIKNIKSGNIKKQQIGHTGYYSVSLDIGKSRKTFDVHRLVAKMFLGEPGDYYVNHKDCDKLNNNLNNLEYTTSKDNTIHALKNGLKNINREKRLKVNIPEDVKIIDGYSNYAIDENGTVYNIKKCTKLKPYAAKNSYVRVQMVSDNKTSKKEYLHRIIAKTFIPNPNNYEIINHKNLDKQDNRIENLEWCTQQQNMIHNADNKSFKRKVMQLDTKHNIINTFDSIKQASISLNINNTSIIHCCAGRAKYAGGFVWKYE